MDYLEVIDKQIKVLEEMQDKIKIGEVKIEIADMISKLAIRGQQINLGKLV